MLFESPKPKKMQSLAFPDISALKFKSIIHNNFIARAIGILRNETQRNATELNIV